MNARDAFQGMTPLLWDLAALHPEKTYLSIVRELLSAGADRTITSNDGKTALDWASERGSQRLLTLLAET